MSAENTPNTSERLAAMTLDAHPRPRVLVAGGGAAGVEALLALHALARGRIALTLLSDAPDFLPGPFRVGEPLAASRADPRPLAGLAGELGARFVLGRLADVDADSHTVGLARGGRLAYDLLVVCVGGRRRPAYRRVITFGAGADPQAFDGALADLEAGRPDGVAFVVPPASTWALPVYELAMVAVGRARSLGAAGLRVTIYTPEPAPLAVFGAEASRYLSPLLAAEGIAVESGARVRQRHDGSLHTGDGRELAAERVAALPALEGPGIPGLPSDEQGFIPVDARLRVRGIADVYAAGDATTFPIKQGGLATRQADAVAAEVAARVGVPIEPLPFRPVLRGVLLTSRGTIALRQDSSTPVAPVPPGGRAPARIASRYLAAWLEHPAPATNGGSEVGAEVGVPLRWHEDPMSLSTLPPRGGVSTHHKPARPAARARSA